ncbi:MAG: MltA-interacting MipA family protein [Proteobacteria bacterium]|nr:MltA-interacting MipA family protein [Pseudomonadota bacterium]MBU4471024.1 MltA-interacting MipA family protein [Pseudomonadota bacterium]MCG2753624.1 MltA-interacting MipA family protein [Desulfobacteraceae bacterium]
MMKTRLFKNLLIAFAALLCAHGSVFAADATLGMDVNSAYVWRGMTLNDGIVFQPSLDVSKGGFGVNVWGNIDGGTYDDSLDSGEFSEVDITLSYGFDLEPMDITIGYIEYLFPTTEDTGAVGTREIYASFGMDIIENLSTTLAIYYDVDEVEDIYANFSLGYSIALSDAASLDLGAGIGYAGDEYTADGNAGFYDYLLSAKLGYSVNDSLNLSAMVAYADSVDEDKLADQDTHFFGGVGLAYGF